MNEENDQDGSLLSGQEPHQKEDMDQATRASAAAFNLEPEKGISPDPDEYNQGDEQGNIKQMPPAEGGILTGDSLINPEEVEEDTDIQPGEFDVSPEELKNLDAQDRDQNEEA